MNEETIKKDTYLLNDQEFNLAKMFKETILKVMNKYPHLTNEGYAGILCISDRTFYRYKRRFNIVKVHKIEYLSL